MSANKEDFIVKLLTEAGYSNIELTFTPATNQKNFFGSVYRVKVAAVKNGGKTTSLRLFLKKHGDCAERNARVKIHEKFNREALVYNRLIPAFDNLQKYLSIEDRILFPRCLHADDAWLVLDELTGFESLDEKSTLDLAHLNMMIEELAKYHALSYALRHKNPEAFREISGQMSKPNIADKQRRAFIIGRVWDWTMSALEDENLKTRLENKKEPFLNEYDGFEQTDYTVMIHGDYNLRNVMFSYKEDDKSLTGMRMIDFQLSYVTSPVADLFFVLFSSTDSKMRMRHYNEMLDRYFKLLKVYLRLHDCDPDVCYPEEVYRRDFGTYFTREFMTVLMIIRIMGIAYIQNSSDDSGASGSGTILDYGCPAAEEIFKRNVNVLLNDLANLGLV